MTKQSVKAPGPLVIIHDHLVPEREHKQNGIVVDVFYSLQSIAHPIIARPFNFET